MNSKRTVIPSFSVAAAACLAFVLAENPANGAIIGINGSSSSVQTIFDDTNSLNSSSAAGTTNNVWNSGPWSGSPISQPTQIDTITGDSTSGNFFAFFTPTTPTVFLNSVQLTQPPGNSGYADLIVRYSVEFQTDAAGLPTSLMSIPTYSLSGSVQPGGFAYFRGSITYQSAALGQLDMLNYSYVNTTAGPISANVSGSFSNTGSITLPASDTLTLIGLFEYKVDPASLTVAQDFVPEPTSGTLVGLGALAVLLRRRRARRA